MTPHPHQLIQFVQHLYAMHVDFNFGFNGGPYDQDQGATGRCQRWLDAVLPPPKQKPEPTTPDIELPGP